LKTNEEIAKTAVDKLSSPPSRKALLELIRWLDIQCAPASAESLPPQILARAVFAVGNEFVKKGLFARNHSMMQAVAQYILEPTEEQYDRYFTAATNSYPYGSGDGCYAIEELGYEGCEPGSGCASGAGSLASMAIEIGEEDTLEIIARELLPWLQNNMDGTKRHGGSAAREA
jgi:hypothetical protein